MINKFGNYNWMQNASPIDNKRTNEINSQQRNAQNSNNTNGGDLMSKLNALDNYELKPKTDSKLDFYA